MRLVKLRNPWGNEVLLFKKFLKFYFQFFEFEFFYFIKF